MNFVSLIFLLFFVSVFALHWSLKTQRHRNSLLLIASYFFYGWWDARFCILILMSSVLDYYIGAALARTNNPQRRKILLFCSLGFNLGLLALFKYFNFFVDSLIQSASLLGITLYGPVIMIALPVGISFYTFQTLSYTLDVYQRKMEASDSLLEFSTFVSFFPQLVAGPIERAAHLLPQFKHRKTFDYAEAVAGCQLILWGFFKKVAIADPIGIQIVDPIYRNFQTASSAELILATLGFAFQIYGDFSGYSNIAIGTAKLFGIQLCDNFDKPYLSKTLNEFWRRWHMSLYYWFRDYVYIPLGGSRCHWLTGTRNLLITFGLSGLWHGANWTFVIWGLLNGLALVPNFILQKRKAVTQGRTSTPTPPPPQQPRIPPILSGTVATLGTFSFICVTWVFFRSATMGQAIAILQTIFAGLGFNFVVTMSEGLGLLSQYITNQATITMVALFLLIGCEIVDQYHATLKRFFLTQKQLCWSIYSIAFWLIILQVEVSSDNFIYFQF